VRAAPSSRAAAQDDAGRHGSQGRDKGRSPAEFQETAPRTGKLLDALGEDNPFPYSFEVQVDKPERIQEIVPQIEKMPGVETAKFGQEVVEHLFQLTRILRLGGIFLIIMLAIATLFIISNTIRITVFARRREVSIMKYVGATNWFIRWPFLLEGMFMGFVGALIAAVALFKMYDAAQVKIYSTLAFFPLLPSWPFMVYLCAGLVAVGTFIGAAGSAISLRKFLDV
jgi:cell division transport system permease protein